MSSAQAQPCRTDSVEPASRSNATGERFERLRPEAALGLWRDACLPLNFSYAECHACERACPVAALRVEGNALCLSDACIGCGRCAAACPTGALAVAGCTVPATVPADNSGIYVDCWKVPRADSPPAAVRVPCLGGLAVSQWLALALAADGRPVIALDRGWCAGCCAGGIGPHPAQGPLTEAATLLADAGVRRSALPALHTRRLPIARMPRTIPSADDERAVSRRDFFGRLAREATAAVAQAQEKKPAAQATRPTLRPGALRAPERERRLDMLTRLAKRARGELPARLFATLAASDRCRNHRVCVALCPTAALRGYDNAGDAGIALDPLACIACGACERGCPEQALRLLPHTGSGMPPETTRLTHHRLRECAACGRPFTASGELCAPCRKSQALVQGVFASLFSGGQDRDRDARA